MKKSYSWLAPLLIISFLGAGILPDSAFGQSSCGEAKLDEKYFARIGSDFQAVITSPKNWRGLDFLRLSALLGVSLVLYSYDQEIYDEIQEHRSSFSRDFSPYISKFGNGLYLAGLITALYASGEAFHDSCLRRTALISLESYITSGVLVLGLKFIAGRARPGTGEGSGSFKPFSLASSRFSFPSGDACSAFAVATVIASETKNIAVDALAYSLAALAAFYRVHDRKHWPSDIFVGSALGYFVAKKIVELNKKADSAQFHAAFSFRQNQTSLSVSLRF
jgi:membrane-associated phospholipid phosphatase